MSLGVDDDDHHLIDGAARSTRDVVAFAALPPHLQSPNKRYFMYSFNFFGFFLVSLGYDFFFNILWIFFEGFCVSYLPSLGVS